MECVVYERVQSVNNGTRRLRESPMSVKADIKDLNNALYDD